MSTPFSSAWSVHKVADFLARVSACDNEEAALAVAVEQAAETFDADVAAIVADDAVLACIGISDAGAAHDVLILAASGPATVTLDGIGECVTNSAPIGDADGRLVLIHRGGPFNAEDHGFLTSIARLLGMTLGSLRMLDAIRSHEASLGAVIRSALDCIISIDAGGHVLEWNPAAEATFGYTREEAMGRVMAELIVPERLREAHTRGMHHYLRSGEGPVIDTRIEVPAIRRDGTEFPVELTVTTVPGEHPTFTAYLRDISERVAANERLVATTQRMGALIENLNAAVLVEDEERRIALANTTFCELFGLSISPEELTGRDSVELFRAAAALTPDPLRCMARMDAVFAAGAPALGDEVPLVDGRVFERDHIPIRVEGQLSGRLWVLREITDRIAFEQALKDARDDALAASRLKSSFLATMSHEIRTPMNGVVGLVDLLLNSRLDPDQQELVQMLDRSSDHLLDVIDDILDFSRIEAGELLLEQTPFVPAVMVRDVVDLFTPRAQEGELELRGSVDADLEQRFVSDPGRIRQVVQNLVGNAVKFTRKGSVDVRASLEPAAMDGARILRVSVADTGIGIPADVADRLFEPFVQADASTSRLFGGSGLGLSICLRLAELLGGSITVASEAEVGSTFTFRVPLVPAAPVEAAAPAARIASDGEQPGSVLVVEDNPVNQVVVQRQLDQLGFSVVTVASGVQALETLESDGRFDVVLMDCQMPGMDGFTATRAIRALPAPRNRVPVIAMTANALREDRDACLAAGMDDYLSKPVRLEDLREMLVRWVAASRAGAPSGQGGSSGAVGSGGARLAPPEVDRSVLDVLVSDLGGDESVLDEFVAIFLRELPSRSQEVRDQLAGSDRVALRDRAHALRSPSRALGLARLDAVCERIERAALNGDVPSARALEGEFVAACDATEAALRSLASG